MEDEGGDGGHEGSDGGYEGDDGGYEGDDGGDNDGGGGYERGGDSGGRSGERGERSSFGDKEVGNFSLTRDRESSFHFEMSKEYNDFMGREEVGRDYLGYSEKFRQEINESKQAVREVIEGTGIIDFEQVLQADKLIFCLENSELTISDIFGSMISPTAGWYETAKEIALWTGVTAIGYMLVKGVGPRPLGKTAANVLLSGNTGKAYAVSTGLTIMDIAKGYRDSIKKAEARMDRCRIQTIQK